MIVLLDNDGGGIFHFLPAAREGEDFVEHIATPHGLDFAHAAALYGLRLGARRRRRRVPRSRSTTRSPPSARRSSASAPTASENVALHRARLGVRPRRHVASPRDDGRPDHAARRSRHPPASTRRTTSKGIGPGDIVEIDKKGRRFHALVTELEQLETGRFELGLRPLDSRISYRTASVREVIDVWRRAGRPTD